VKSARTALIAGGSRGIGYAIAHALAKRGYDLVLIARTDFDLEKAKDQLQQEFKIKVYTISSDLSKEAAATMVRDWCLKENIPLDCLCNVVGIGGSDDFLRASPEHLRYMVDLNINSAVALTDHLLPLLEKNAPAHILNVASMAGFAPIPAKNVYSATKSAVIYFSHALRLQLKKRNIKVTCLAPGPVYTKQEVIKETRKQLGKWGDRIAVEPMRVGEIAVRKMLRGKFLIVPGTFAGLMSFWLRALPKRWVAAIYSMVEKNKI
jgi:short-subunit dehydrogenase